MILKCCIHLKNSIDCCKKRQPSYFCMVRQFSIIYIQKITVHKITKYFNAIDSNQISTHQHQSLYVYCLRKKQCILLKVQIYRKQLCMKRLLLSFVSSTFWFQYWDLNSTLTLFPLTKLYNNRRDSYRQLQKLDNLRSSIKIKLLSMILHPNLFLVKKTLLFIIRSSILLKTILIE